MRWHYLNYVLSLPTHLMASVVIADALAFLKRQWAEWYELFQSMRKL